MFQGRRSVHATPVTEKEERLALSQAEQNVEVVRRGYEAFNTANMAALTELFGEDDAWRTSGRSPIAGDHQGHHKAGSGTASSSTPTAASSSSRRSFSTPG